MSHIHIYRPTSWLGRTMRHCTTCRRRRRFIVRLYEWYSSNWTCGGCGHTWTSGEGRHWSGAKERQRKREWVKDRWKAVRRLREVVRTLCDAIRA